MFEDNNKNFMDKPLISFIFALALMSVSIFSYTHFAQASQFMVRDNNSNFLDYLDKKYNLSLQFPLNWQIIKPATNDTNTIALFSGPLENKTNVHRASIGLYTYDLPYTNISLGQYSNLTINSLIKEGYKIELYNTTHKAQDIITTVIYSNDADGVKGMQELTIQEDRVYLIAFITFQQYFPNYLGFVSHLSSSFL